MNFKTFLPAGSKTWFWPKTPCDTASDQEVCAFKAFEFGLCGALLAHGRCCVEPGGACRLENHNKNRPEVLEHKKWCLEHEEELRKTFCQTCNA